MGKIKGMTTCKVCGRDFPLIAEEQRVVKDPSPTGFTVLVNSSKRNYDAFDCPHCGCQNIMQERKPFACPCDYGICDECEGEEEFDNE